MKTIRPFILALLLVAAPAAVQAQGDFDYTTNADGVSLTITGGYAGYPYFGYPHSVTGFTLAIPTNINGLLVTGIAEWAFYDSPYVTIVTIPAGVTSIGEYAFGVCISLTAIIVDAQNSHYSSTNGVLFDKNQSRLIQFPGGVSGSYTIPDSVTSIAEDAFSTCTTLTNVTIPGSVTNIEEYAFFGTGLTNVAIPNGVTSIGADAFQECYGLTHVSIAGSVTNIGQGAFYYCFGLASVTIGNGLTSIGQSAFFCCTHLTAIWFAGNAPACGWWAFSGDTNATAYYLPGTTGWSSFSVNTGVSTVLWNPLIQVGGSNFGVQGNQFGFNITGTTNIPIVVEACTDLVNPVWVPLQTNALTNGSFYFSEPLQTNSPGRFYRISSP
ncbi:MAG: leucine-rich repeat domain-containing protein [Verrucomicrobiota bacterium]|jgi:hypothetical protein